MANKPDTTLQLLRKIVREEVADIRGDIRLIVREVVREETVDMRADIKALQADTKLIRRVQGQQSITLRAMQSDLGGLKNSFRSQAREMHKLGVLFEDLDHRFQAGNELY